MTTQIFRSLGFKEGTQWGNELLSVEVLINESDFDIIIYDRGFEPPYYDVSKPFWSPFERENMTGGLEQAHEFLKTKNIFVNAWRKVPMLFLQQSNSLIREDIRIDLKETTYNEIKIPPQIPLSIGKDAFSKMSEYSGHSAEVSIHFLDHNEPLSYAGSNYLMFRTPPQYNWGVVAKGGENYISLLIECIDSLKCQIYDQLQKRTFLTGELIYAKFEFITAPICFELTHTGLEVLPIKQAELISF